MAELNDKLITYGNLSTFYNKLQEQGLGGNAIEDASVLPDASENKSKLIRLESDDNVYVSELKSRTSITTNRLPDAQQIDKAYLYEDLDFIYYYAGAFKLVCSDGEIDGYLWIDGDDEEYVFTNDNAENITVSSECISTYGLTNVSINLIDKTISTSDMLEEVELEYTQIDEFPMYLAVATYNAPEANQIGNATMEVYNEDTTEWETIIYTGEQISFYDADGETQLNGYKWEDVDNSDYCSATLKPASELYLIPHGSKDFPVYYIDLNNSVSVTVGCKDIYIPQLNAPDSEQVNNATIQTIDYFHTYIGDETTILVNGVSTSVYTWTDLTDNETIYSTKSASEIYNTDKDSDDVHFYCILDGNGYELTFAHDDLEAISTVKYQRTEVTEEWDWQPLTDNATNDDIDLMFAAPESPVVKRVLMKDSEDYGYSINEGWINFNDETMSYDGGTYYKWLKYSESEYGEAVKDVDGVSGGDYFILTDTLNPTLPFDVNSNECVYDFEIESEGETYRLGTNETYSKMALIHKDGSITYEE